MRSTGRFISILILALGIPAWAVGPTVTNVQARQWQDSSREVEINYTLTDPDSATVFVSVAISNDGGRTYAITPTHVAGDIGSVRPGGRRTIVWDAKAEYPTAVWSSCKAKVTADGSGGGIHPGEMVYIPAGSFLMGNNGHEPNSYYVELPQHSVYLSGYHIGKYEVTRGEYRQFMQAGGYSNPAYWSSAGWYLKNLHGWTEPRFWAARTCFHDYNGSGWWCNPATCPQGFTQTDSHPVVGVTYYEAEAFCNWVGGHLPTEAQWEKAARWTGSYPNVYPWGNTWDAEKCNNFEDDNAAGGGYLGYQTAPVGSYPSGASPYGCQDMAGNVWEWAKDWNQYSYYSLTPPGGWSDPQGPASGDNGRRVQRGDSFYGCVLYYISYFRCASRGNGVPEAWGFDYWCGFRLAR